MFSDDSRRRDFVVLAAFWVLPLVFFAARRRFSPPPPPVPHHAAAAKKPKKPAPDAAPKFPLVAADGQARSPSAASNFAALTSLPYILQSPDPRLDLRGVIVNKPALASPGLNFFFPWSLGNPGKAYLMDMNGKILWRWSLEPYLGTERWRPWVEHFELLPDGSVLCGLQDRSILKLDRDSKLVWECKIRAHHDIWPAANGDIYVLSQERKVVPDIHPTIPIESDAITTLSGDGKVKKSISILDLFRRSGYAWLFPRLQEVAIDPKNPGYLDVFHLNHVEPLDGTLAAKSPIFAKGNLLFSVRNLDVIGIIDARSEKIVWLWGPGNLAYQHDPRMLPNGHILIFDNGVDHSQVIEMDPLSREIVWRYAPPKGFFSSIAGAAERLPNGNTLVTESMKGYAFEVTPSGEIVWKYANPENDGHGKRNGIIRMTRVDPARLTFLPK